MNRRLVAIFVALVCIVSVCPPSRAQHVEVGLRGGPIFSTLQGDTFALTHSPGQNSDVRYYSGNVGHRVGAQLTVAVTVPFTPWFALQPELQYAQKGATLTIVRSANCGGPRIYCIPMLLERTPLSYRLSYLQLPVLLQARIPVGSIGVSLLAGPSVGLNLGAELATESFDVSGLPNVSTPESHAQVGIVGGVELSYCLGNGGTLLLDIRLHPTLTEIPLERTEASVRSPAAETSLGWVLPWGGRE